MAFRATTYFLLLVLLSVSAFGPIRSEWRSGHELHELLETLATLLAFVVGALALVRFYSKKRGTFLFLGTGFLGTGLLDALHLLVSAGFWGDQSLAELQDRSSWTFTASGSYLGIFLFVSWMAWRREREEGEVGETREGAVYSAAGFLVALIFLVFALFPATRAFYPESPVRHPAEFFTAGLFLLALMGYLQKGEWRYGPFEHWLVLALIVSVMAHGAYMAFSAASYDADYDTAHLLKLLSYGFVLVGLLASVYTTFRREEAAAATAREANTALAREIDVRRMAERVRQESEERLRDFLDNAHDLIQSVAPDGKFLYVNRAWKEVLGYSEKDLETLGFFDILHPECLDRCERLFVSVLQGDSLPSVDVDFVAADGRMVRCSGSANAFMREGQPVATRAILRDITDAHNARQQLQTFQANLRALVENTGEAIWSVNREYRLLTFNTAFAMGLEAWTGREPKDNDTPEDCFPPEDATWYRGMYRRSLRGEAFADVRDEVIGGQLRSYELYFNPIREAMGITGVAVFSKDVTARRQTQEALRMAKEEAERANTAKSQFLANMSHELRTPLNSVIGFTNILLKNRGGNLAQQELGFLERISANGVHLLELINEVLDLAKIEAGRMELELRSTNLEALLSETISQMEGQVKGRPVTLRSEIPEGLPELQVDAGKLKQVVINLVGNALKFTEEGEVAVVAVPAEDRRSLSMIRVMDTGIGIPPDRLKAIFEAFQQADGTTSRKYGGTGLGLTISRSLCQLMGYELRVESEVGKGSTFSILMESGYQFSGEPREEGGIEEPVSRGEAPPYRILVMDPDERARESMARFLQDLDYDVETAETGAEGLRKGRANPPDLITLDMRLPSGGGWVTLRDLKGDPSLRDIPVVVVSALSEKGPRSKMLGSVDLLLKPVERDEFIQTLRRHVKIDADRTVLVVDDEEDARVLLRRYLEESGLSVVTAVNGEEAEKCVARAIPDAIVLDLAMPVMDGITFLSHLRAAEESWGIPVVICTGKDLTSEEKESLAQVKAGIVSKGDRFEEELRQILSHLLSPGTGRRSL